MVSGAGSGLSRCGPIAINRWRNDATADAHGQWVYLRDIASGRTWSAGHMPVGTKPSSYGVTMANDRVEIRRRDADIETVTEIVVVPGENAESRRVTVMNHSDTEREIELTSYQEVVLAPILNDRGHRAFSSLFVQTEWVEDRATILAMRRPRSAKDSATWCGHTVAMGDASRVTCETDRARFVGRGRSVRNPIAMGNPGDLEGNTGSVLDPVMALRTMLRVPAGSSASVIFSTFFAADRDEAMRLAGLLGGIADAANAFELAGKAAANELASLGITAAHASLYQDLAGELLFSPSRSGPVIENGEDEPGRTELLALGVTGESPIVLAHLDNPSGLATLGELLGMHRYWQIKSIACDLVIIWNGEEVLEDVLAGSPHVSTADLMETPLGVLVRRAQALSERQMKALEATARMRFICDGQRLGDGTGD
jgi:cyclic beta-1,2-glucan synthetase